MSEIVIYAFFVTYSKNSNVLLYLAVKQDQWFLTLKVAKLRTGWVKSSKEKRMIPSGVRVHVTKRRGNRMKIDVPWKGWVSMNAENGQCLLVAAEVSFKNLK